MPHGFQFKLTIDQIAAILQREFGSEAELKLAQEMGGGTFNETYLVEVTEKPQMILRVAPPASADTYWDDVALMRREHHTCWNTKLTQRYFQAFRKLRRRTLYCLTK